MQKAEAAIRQAMEEGRWDFPWATEHPSKFAGNAFPDKDPGAYRSAFFNIQKLGKTKCQGDMFQNLTAQIVKDGGVNSLPQCQPAFAAEAIQ